MLNYGCAFNGYIANYVLLLCHVDCVVVCVVFMCCCVRLSVCCVYRVSFTCVLRLLCLYCDCALLLLC